jgi:DNA-binding MarR family transcriptional regulator
VTSGPRLLQPRALPDMLLYRINRLRAVGGGMVLRYCEGRFGITRREWVMLALLSAGEPVSSSELAARAELDKSATSKALAGLQARGLVVRSQRAGDRRFARLALSDEGRALYERILPLVDGINRRLLSVLSEEEVAQLDGMLARMQQQADELWREAEEDLPRADRRHGGTRSVER